MGLTTSCDGFLTETPETAVPEAEAMSTLKAAEEVCIGVYSTFKNPALYSGTLVQAPEVQSDLFYAAKGYTNRFGNFYRWEVNANDAELLSVYGGLYQIVNRCNFYLDHEAEVRSRLTAKSDIAQIDKFTADVCFMRAYAYSDLIRLFCQAYDPATAASTLGVPMYLHYREGDGSTVIKPRQSLDSCYAQVLADLTRAEELEPRVGSNTQFVTKGAIMALRARVLLNMQRWAEAEEYATKVIDMKNGSGRIYALASPFKKVIDPSGAVSDEYTQMWKFDTADEIIWRIQFSTTDMGGSIGNLYMGITSGRYNPNFFPADWLLNSYTRGDVRYETFFVIVNTILGVSWEVMKKFPGNPEIDGTSGVFYTNMPKMLRLSETYLIRAEARCMQDKIDLGCQDLSELQSKRIPEYGGSRYTTRESLLKAIQDERAKELIGEGFRLTDLKRWNLGFERTPQTGTIEGPNYNALKVLPGSKRFTWLLPEHEITASHGIVVQNEQ